MRKVSESNFKTLKFLQLLLFLAIDTVLSDILPKSVYFRLNPNLSTNVPMDEGRIEMLEQVQFDARKHLEKIDETLKTCAKNLLQDKTVLNRGMDRFRNWYRTTWADIFVMILYTLTSLCIFSILFFIHFLRCWWGEFG